MSKSEMEMGRDLMIASVRRTTALWDAAETKLAARATTPRVRPGGATRVFSFRIDAEELAALERRAALVDLKPSVLARNLVRVGLASDSTDAVSAIVDRLESAVAELRSLVP